MASISSVCTLFMDRYGTDAFGNISELKVMSYKELKEQLGIDPDSSFSPVHKPSSQTDKLLSFISDSCYLTPDRPGGHSDSRSTSCSSISSLSDSESVDSCSITDTNCSNRDCCVEVNSNLIEQFDTHCLSPCTTLPNETSLSLSELTNLPVSTPHSPSVHSGQSFMDLSDSGLPQPLFSLDTLSPLSCSSRNSPAGRGHEMVAGPIAFGPGQLNENTNTAPAGHSSSPGQPSPGVLLERTRAQGGSCDNSCTLCEPLSTGFRQGTKEAPLDSDVNHTHSLPAQHKGISPNAQKAHSRMISRVKGRIPLEMLQVDNNVISPCFHGDMLSKTQPHPFGWCSSLDYKENQGNSSQLGKKKSLLRN